MPKRSHTPLIRNVFDGSFDEGDDAAMSSLTQAMTQEQQRREIADILRRLKRIEQAVRVSRLRDETRTAGAAGEGTSVAELRRRVQRVKALTSPNVTRRSKSRARRMAARHMVTGRSGARTRRMNSGASE